MEKEQRRFHLRHVRDVCKLDMTSQTNQQKVPADLVMRLRRATGLPVMVCKDYLRTVDPDLLQRILMAYEDGSVGSSYLRDPIEFDPRYAHAFAEAEVETQREVAAQIEEQRQDLRERGLEHLEYLLKRTGHLHWNTKQRILKEQFDIDWKTPSEMNSRIYFD